MAKKSDDRVKQEVKLDMTPMIDVTFQLLIFFMCTIKFKMLEGKLAAYLPKDQGVNNTPMEKPLDKMDLRILTSGAHEGQDPRFPRKKRKIQDITYYVSGFRTTDIKAFKAKVAAIHKASPETKATLAPDEDTLTDYVVKVMDACIEVGLTDITFKGSTRIR